MRNEKGITLTALVIYIVIMILVFTMMNVIITDFYNNTDTVRGNVQEVIEFNKFNTYFLKEIKSYNNEIEKVEENYILFKSGNSFSESNGTIYYNNIAISKGIREMKIEKKQNNIVKVTLKFENFNKSIKYKVENIY